MPTPTLANMRANLARKRQEYANAAYAGYMAVNTRRGFSTTPTPASLKANRLYDEVRDLERRIDRREKANAARSAARRAKERRVARSVVAKWRARAMRPPNASVFGNAGGATYRRHAASVASPTLTRIMRQLEELRELNKNKNKGNAMNKFDTRRQMVELYENMYNKMSRASNWKTAANVVNKAQAIMFKAHLL